MRVTAIRRALRTRRATAAIPKVRSSVRLVLSIFTSDAFSSLAGAAAEDVDPGPLIKVVVPLENPVIVEVGTEVELLVVVVELSKNVMLDVASGESWAIR
jgi:hypothetical protein